MKSFLGTSANAVKTRIWTALIAMLILKYLQMRSSLGWSLSNLAALVRQQLFIFRDLWAWLNNPLDGPPAARKLAEQLSKEIVLYSARHTFATKVMGASGDLPLVMRALGHTNALTAMIYQHSSLENVRKIVNERPQPAGKKQGPVLVRHNPRHTA